MAGRGCVSGRSKECNYIAVSGDSCRNGCEETADQPCPDRCFIPCRHWMADSGGTDIVAGMAAVPAAGSRISDAQLYITGTGGIRGRPSASDGWNLAGIWADVRRSDAGTHSLFGTLRSSGNGFAPGSSNTSSKNPTPCKCATLIPAPGISDRLTTVNPNTSEYH